MSEVKDEKAEAKTQVEKLKSDYGAQDMGTYMDARSEGKVLRVAVWNEGLKSYQPTEEGVALLATPSPKEKAKDDKEKPKDDKAKAKPPLGQPASMPPPAPTASGGYPPAG